MSAVFEILQRSLIHHAPAYEDLQRALQEQRRHMPAIDLARTDPALRLVAVLQGIAERRAGYADAVPLLRQCIIRAGGRLTLHTILWRNIEDACPEHGLLEVTATNEVVELAAPSWNPPWLAHTDSLNQLEVHRYDEPSVGDGLLYAMSGEWETYQSEAQKAAVHAVLFAAPGSTTLVSLPTGAGKSLCAVLPAWFDSQGGSIPGGTTLVVVPTVALAIEQATRAAQFFKHALTPEHQPHGWTAHTPQETRNRIRQAIQQGTLPLLFLSPEALMNSNLYDICLEGARNKKIRRLVIDEAHLVETWGAGFRTDFQFLSTYRRQLVEASDGMLTTLLLSATISVTAEHLLEELFADDHGWNLIHAGRLRPEIRYWMAYAHTWEDRSHYVLEALRYLPRPLILYVATPDIAKEWIGALRRIGYRRLNMFTGDTTGSERESLLRQWNDGSLDIMVATSAFGLGVDKRDIRTIVHACLPENVDRFYQEVGRSGRDGCSAISLLCTTHRDYDIAKDTVDSARITPERAWPRWQGMLRSGQFTSGQDATINLDAVPPDQPDMRHSDKNRDWNEHTLLLMQRAGMLQIQEARTVLPGEVRLRPDGQTEHWMQIQIVQPAVVDDVDRFTQLLDEIREAELNALYEALALMRQLVHDSVESRLDRCMAHTLARIYPNTDIACGGCPACRANNLLPYAAPLPLLVEMVHDVPTSTYLNADLAALLQHSRTLHIVYSPPVALSDMTECLLAAVQLGIQQFILPDNWIGKSEARIALLQRLAQHCQVPHRLLSISLIRNQGAQAVYRVPTLIVYPADTNESDHLHQSVKRALPIDVPRVNVIPSGLYLLSEHGAMIERINGVVRDASALVNLAQQRSFEWF